MWKCSVVGVVVLLLASIPLASQSPTFGVGRPPTPEDFRELATAIAPDGTGLPEGSGTVAAGREVFAAQCARCHGQKAEGDIGPILVGGQGTLRTPKPLKTVGSFWPYATTLFDYFVFKTGAAHFRIIAAVLQGPNFKGALIELSFDLGAPFRYRF